MKIAMALCATVLVVAPGIASSQDLTTNRTQTLNLTVEATDVFTISNTGNVTVSVTANGSPQTFTTQGGNYTVTTNAASADAREIMVSIQSLITDVTVELSLAYTGTNGSSAGFVTLTTSPQPAVTGIYASSAATQAITYKITAPVTVPPQNPTRTVTYTLIDTP
jgi:hypothetical protein